jgi:hypothetical protein|tara:strand:- start:456 stop:629 length:174 start_codon:yes stop_codon:yes gene_type:complete
MIEDMSYAQLRNMQNSHIGKSFSKLSQMESTLVQQTENLDIDTQTEIEVDAAVDTST